MEFLRSKVVGTLKKLGYKVPVTEPMATTYRAIPKDTETIATRETTYVQINYGAHALNSIGNNPRKVAKVFGELIRSLAASGYDPKHSVSFYEVISNVIIKSETPPLDMIERSVRVDTRAFAKFGGASVSGIHLVSSKGSKKQVDVAVEADPNNPIENFLIRLTFRSDDSSVVSSFSLGIDKMVINILESLGAK